MRALSKSLSRWGGISFLVVSLAALAPDARAVIQLETQAPGGSVDARAGRVAPLAAATSLVASQGWTARWNRFGTVQTLYKPGGVLATGLTGDPETAARGWIVAHGALFRLTDASPASLALVRSEPLNQSGASVLLFRQVSNGVAVGAEGRIKIGLVDGKLFWVASNAVGDLGAVAPATITPAQAWLAAAARVPLGVATPTVTALGAQNGWTLLDAPGYTGAQRVRPTIIAMPGATAVPGFEANVVRDAPNGQLTGYTAYVDARNANVLIVADRVAQLKQPSESRGTKADRVEAYSGDYAPVGATCGPCHPFAVADSENYVRLAVTLSGDVPANDITLDLYQNDATCSNGSNLLAHSDTGVSTEAINYTPSGGRLPTGTYYVHVCQFSAPVTAPTTYNGSVAFQETTTPEAIGSNPQWSQFPVSPPLDHSGTDTRMNGCWFASNGSKVLEECDDEFVDGSSHHIAWDYVGSAPTLTTTGNNARSYEGWNVAIGGGSAYQPAPNRSRLYAYPWTNEWFTSTCDPASITHASTSANDVDAAVTNLFTLHNRLHDFAYHLGLRERTGAAQTSNYGQTDQSKEQDQEMGAAQAGAMDGGFPDYLGRDNANQLTLQDGVAPISNMYLWQTIGGAIYVPCVDGDFDGQVIAHEFGHMVQNRLTDPDSGLSGQAGRSMGEGWSDLNAMMFFHETGIIPESSARTFLMGSYVTGDSVRGIRNFRLDRNPLNFSDVGYDVTCDSGLTNVAGTCDDVGEVHADGEVWTGIQHDVRATLMAKYAASVPDDMALARQCADGEVFADHCPGERRWAQLIHDGMLLQPLAPTMIDARDAILAADLARSLDSAENWTSNQSELWTAFARRGLGASASTAHDAVLSDSENVDPTPGFDTPSGANTNVTFDVRSLAGQPVAAKVYVGAFEARATAVADTDSNTALGSSVAMSAGEYDVLVVAPGYGHSRFHASIAAGGGARTFGVRLAPNYASASAGATASGDGASLDRLIDDTEATTWKALATSPSVDVAQPAVTVVLAGGRHTIDRVAVSGMLEIVQDAVPENRFSSIHRFAIDVCDSSAADCASASSYSRVTTGTFPSSALRPLVPDMTIRDFRFAPVDATHVRFVALDNKCTGTPAYQGYLGVSGQEDADPSNSTDCRVGNVKIAAKNVDVRAAELEVFGADSVVGAVVDGLFSDSFE